MTPTLLEAAAAIALAPAEANQVSGGGSNARFGALFDEPPTDELRPPPRGRVPSSPTSRDRSRLRSAAARGVSCHRVDSPAALTDVAAPDAVVVAMAGSHTATGAAPSWERILAEHHGTSWRRSMPTPNGQRRQWNWPRSATARSAW